MFTPTIEWTKAYQQKMLDIAKNEKRAKESKVPKPDVKNAPENNGFILSLGAGVHPLRHTKPHTTL
jgi:hypothetical protein